LFKRLALILAVVTAGSLGAVAIATPAQATPTCDYGRICWFDASNWQTDATHPKYVVNPSGLPANTCSRVLCLFRGCRQARDPGSTREGPWQ
jgi:hypothetical protein